MSETDDRAAISAPTPEYLRTLADAALDADLIPADQHDALFARLAVNLRAAADQLETLTVEHDALRAQRNELEQRILTADTAPQENRDV